MGDLIWLNQAIFAMGKAAGLSVIADCESSGKSGRKFRTEGSECRDNPILWFPRSQNRDLCTRIASSKEEMG